MIPITRPLIGDAERRAILEPLDSGWLMQGPRVAQFEREMAKRVGRDHGVAVSSGTAALHVALLAAGVGPGQRVALPSFTFIACANVVRLCGATPVFIDVDPATFNFDPDDLRRRGRGVDAVMAVHQFGRPAELDGVCEELGVACLIEDSACALGAVGGDGLHVGGAGDAMTLSFHPRKVITTGDGGMLLTDDAELAARARALRNHGAEGGGHKRPGLNYRLTDMQAAVGLAQLARLDGILEARREQAGWYAQALPAVSWLTPPAPPDTGRHAWQSYVCLIDEGGPERDGVLQALEAQGVSARPGATACHALGWCREESGLSPDELPGAWAAHRRSLALPLYPGLTRGELDTVVAALATC